MRRLLTHAYIRLCATDYEAEALPVLTRASLT